ncbi:zinc-ribbon domain-containing protein [Paracoccus sp. N5]|uniref:zinc-ribbon domain-containing protein n=1 Tax=Paracoccus sp. N5 TaxID=1101189 RepID=UPI000382BFC2|nr:zinc-ribbon domain-containing protein [Paracoccus sp. N5]
MRLTCPRCAAQYQIADAAIPPAGREVECSACGHVWHQEGPAKSAPEAVAAAPEPGFDPQARPVLNRALDESVLSILREEAARELRVRKGETPEPAESPADHIPATKAAAEAAPESAPQIDWPATTLTVPETPPDAAPAPAEPQPAEAPAAAAPADPAPPEPVQPDPPEPVLPALPDAAELAATLTRPAAPLPEPSPAPEPALEAARTALRPAAPDEHAEAPAAPVPVLLPAERRRSGYGAGFGLAAMLALGLVAVYALVPQIPADRGGATLAEWRQGIDRGRLWLHDRILGD